MATNIQKYVRELVKQKYKEYHITIPFDELPWSGEIIDTKLNDGTFEPVDRLVEFTLCAVYSYYFIDRYGWTIPAKGGPIPFKLHDFQKEALEAFQNNSKVIFRKSRQVGASVITGAYALWLANFQKAEMIKIISMGKDAALEFKEKTVDINYENMPGFLKTNHTRDGLSKTKLKLVNKSQIQVLAKSKNAGRGGTPSLIIIDEAAFNEWMDDIWKSIEPSLDKGGDCIVISTTNGVGNWYHLTYTRAEEKQNEFHAIYIPWWRYPGRSNPWLQDILDGKIENVDEFVKAKEREQLSYEGPPKDAPWLWKRRANAKSEKEFQQEILAQFLGSGDTVITPKTINRMAEFIEDPKFVDRLPQDPLTTKIRDLWVWKDVEPGRDYLLSADTATGHGKDYSTFQIIDVHGKEQVAEFKSQLPTDTFGMIIKKCARYYNDAFVIIESNHPGPAVFNEVHRSKEDPYYNVYLKKKGNGQFVSWETTPKSRVMLIEDLFKDLENGYTKVYSERLFEEIKTFVWNDNGKAEAMSNYNDDLVISYSLYCHLKDEIFTSRPVAMSSSKSSLTGGNEEAEMYWNEQEEKFLENTGMSMKQYYWLQGKPLPQEYIEIKRKEREIEQQDNSVSDKELMKKIEENYGIF